MARTLWFAAGAGAAVYAMNRARRVRDALTPDGLRDRAQGLALGARMFRDEVAQGRTEKETELRMRLGLVPNGTPELESGGRHRALVEAPEVESPDKSPDESPDKEGST